MFYKDSNDNKYYLGRAFDYGDIQYGAGAATHAKFTELGFTQVTIDHRPDDRFYVVTGPDANGAYSTTPRDLNALKLGFIMDEKLNARRLLENTDWLVVRNQESNDAIPANVATYRSSIRTVSSTRCNQINGVTTVAALQTLLQEDEMIDDPSNPGNLIQNTNALTAYPDQYEEQDDVQTAYGL